MTCKDRLYCGPEWMKTVKILPREIALYFCPDCRVHDADYETWVSKWVCDLWFFRRMLKRARICTTRRRHLYKFWALLFYMGVSIPILSHISYYRKKKFFKDDV